MTSCNTEVQCGQQPSIGAGGGHVEDEGGNPMHFWQETLHSARYVMAPMVDMSELPFRMLGRAGGVQLCYTPMLHAQRYVNEDHYRKHNFTTCPGDRPLIVQFCANDAQTFTEAARLVQPFCDAVDLNLGCPQAIAKKGHYGSFLQGEWDLIRSIVTTASRELSIPVTCKIRIHPDLEETIKYAQMIEAAGCKLLAVHGRTREQKGHQTGLADWDYIKAIKANVRIPVLANGNILSRDDAERCIAYTGVDGVMAAEGLLHNPSMFSDLHPPVWEMARSFLSTCATYPIDVGHIRTHLFRILAYSMESHPDLRTRLAEANTIALYQSVIADIEARFAVRQTTDAGQVSVLDTAHAQASNDFKGNSRADVARPLTSELSDLTHESEYKADNNAHKYDDGTTLCDNDEPTHIKRQNSDTESLKKRARFDFTDGLEMALWSANQWRDYPEWLCHARARVSNSSSSGAQRKELYGVHLDRFNASTTDGASGTAASARTKLSKTERKQRVYERRVAGKKLKRRQKRDDRRQRRAQLTAQGVQQRKLVGDDHVTKKDRLTAMKQRQDRAMRLGQRVCIDMSLEHLMSHKELSRLSQQIRRLYGSNRQADRPFHLIMTGIKHDGVLYKECLRKNMGFENYSIDKHEKTHLEVFPVNEIVYLSPDSDEELTHMDESKVYIIGGLVDETVNKGRTTEAGLAARIQLAKLPIDTYMQRADKGTYSKILTVNQVFDILLTYHNTGCWREALGRHVPRRTGYVLKPAEASSPVST